jgi:hypothetical protein
VSANQDQNARLIVDDIKQVRSQLAQSNGTEWDLSLGELQLQYGEACFWILLKSKNEAQSALRKFREIVGPFQKKWPAIRFTVSLNAHEGDNDISVDFLEGDEIQDDAKLRSVGARPIVEPLKDNDIFVQHKKRRI